jgi:hypothetical protein
MLKAIAALPVLAFVTLIAPLQAMAQAPAHRRRRRKAITGQDLGTCGMAAMRATHSGCFR